MVAEAKFKVKKESLEGFFFVQFGRSAQATLIANVTFIFLFYSGLSLLAPELVRPKI